MNRLEAMQLWPLFWLRARAAIFAAASRSASARTTNGSEPPSSSTCFLRLLPARLATRSPTSLEPVRVIAATRGSPISGSIEAPGTSSARNTPSGRPACLTASSMPSAERGTFEACFRTAVLPAISAGARKRITCQNGKFHGMIASTTPSGSNAT